MPAFLHLLPKLCLKMSHFYMSALAQVSLLTLAASVLSCCRFELELLGNTSQDWHEFVCVSRMLLGQAFWQSVISTNLMDCRLKAKH